jgi:hypothetical protein
MIQASLLKRQIRRLFNIDSPQALQNIIDELPSLLSHSTSESMTQVINPLWSFFTSSR